MSSDSDPPADGNPGKSAGRKKAPSDEADDTDELLSDEADEPDEADEADEPDEPGIADEPVETPSDEANGVQRDVSPEPQRLNVLVFSLASFCLIAFGVWLVSAGTAYREEHAQATGGWQVGTTRSVEVTLVKEDKRNLACASDQVVAGLRCAYGRNGREIVPASTDGRQTLQPYNTIANELLLGAGLWTAPDLLGQLPHERFVVVCNYNIKGLVKSASVRYNPSSPFAKLEKTTTVGTLTDCVLPR